MKRGSELLLAILLTGVLVVPGRTQTPPVQPDPERIEPMRSGLYVGAPSCGTSNCHGSVRPRRVFDVLQNEYFTWLKQDPHATRAFRVLFNEQSRIIARNLGLAQAPSETRACLDCHAMAIPADLQARRLDVEDGISCEGCHGPASGWIRSHTASDWSYAQSVEAGMTDLRDLSTRARVCLSCHQGDGSKSVDHDLIAAGHPELVFELDNYSEQMPAHWMPFADKRNTEGVRDTHGVRAWAVGQAASFRQGLDLLSRRARSGRWPEFSEMSCNACHHSLAEERWRSIRYPDRPGLPRWSPARWAVLRHLVEAVAPEARPGLALDVERLARQVARISTPPAEVAQTAERMSRALDGIDGVIARLDRAPWDDAQVRRLLLAVADDSAFLAGADRQSAEQAYLALHSLTGRLLSRDPRLARSGLPATLEAMNREFDHPNDWKPDRFNGQLARFKRQVQGLP